MSAPVKMGHLAHHARHLLARSKEIVEASETAHEAANATTTKAVPTGTIAPYATALNGVNQTMNNIFKISLWWSLGALALLILTIRIVQRVRMHLRHMSAMALSGEQQKYWAIHRTSLNWKWRKWIMYAPLIRKRHNREFKLSTAINMGTLPSRFHSILIALYLGSNFAYCVFLDYSRENRYSTIAELRGRSGVLAVVNMIALIVLAGRNNPLISILQISFDTYNLMHRWMGRTVVVASLVHTACWAYVKCKADGMSGLVDQLRTDPFASWGMVGTVAMVVIFITALSPVRHAFYETFLDIHIIMAIFALIGIYIHCAVAGLPQLPYVKAIMILWGMDRFGRIARILYYNYSRKGWTSTTVQALPGEACRVTMHLPRKAYIDPGTHAYVRISSINVWESHPFSIAWVEHKALNQTLPLSEKGEFGKIKDSEQVTDVSFVIQAQTGFTRKLFNKANASPSKILVLKGAMEGPYAGHHSMDSYGHAVLFAGASGITHQIPFVKHLVQGFHDKTIATRKITLIWIVRDSDNLEWVRPWMDQILRMPSRRECLTIKLFVTRPKNPREIISPSATVQMFPGRPNINLLLENEVKLQTGAMCVTVCGPGGLADNVRDAVRTEQENGVVHFIEESFTW